MNNDYHSTANIFPSLEGRGGEADVYLSCTHMQNVLLAKIDLGRLFRSRFSLEGLLKFQVQEQGIRDAVREYPDRRIKCLDGLVVP